MSILTSLISIKGLIALAITVIVGGGIAGGIVTAVAVSSTTESVEGAQATTAGGTDYAVTQPGSRIALTADAAGATSPVVPGDTATTAVANVGAVTAGDFIYEILYTEDTGVDGASAGTLNARWTIGGVEQTATNITVSALATDTNTAQGGFILIFPGDSTNTPENIQVIVSQ